MRQTYTIRLVVLTAALLILACFLFTLACGVSCLRWRLRIFPLSFC